MPGERVTIQSGGEAFSQWMDVCIEAGAGQAARSFNLSASEPDQQFGDAWPLQPGRAVTVRAGDDIVVTGYIDDYCPEFGAEEGHAFHRTCVTGRSKSKDAIDSSAVHQSGEWKKQSIVDIGQDLLRPFGLTLDTPLKDLKPLPVWRLAPGSTVFSELDALARQEGALLVGTADGGIRLTRADQFKMHAGALTDGVNIKHASARLSERDKHDKVYTRGQKNHGSGAASHRLEHVARDKTVERYRPLIIIAEGDTDAARLKQRCDWQIARTAGWSTTAEITVHGWRDDDGALWDPEKLIFVESSKLKLSQLMAIKQVRFVQNNATGTIATLSLVDPQALGGLDGKGKSDGIWDTGLEDE